MIFYTVKKPGFQPEYLDRQDGGSFEPVPMTKDEAEHVAGHNGGLVQMWGAALMREYEVPEPALPRLVLVG